ncbi:BspC domain-containing protein [Paraburkholderia diazotrophica]|uniref:BspC domain-containing protein n=1 Tax=Paraburkholderia diazotrophica TaxID=667676 RepID=UPI00316D6ADB
MKSITALSGILCLIWFCSTAFSQSPSQADVPDDYAYLTRLHVRPAVINCIAELDRWIRTTSRYDMFLAPDRRVLKARVDGGSGIFSGNNGAQPVESTVTMRAFARVRSKQSWIPVVAKCGIWHEHVVGVSLQKYEGHTPVVH